jgi:hypothetical protein
MLPGKETYPLLLCKRGMLIAELRYRCYDGKQNAIDGIYRSGRNAA